MTSLLYDIPAPPLEEGRLAALRDEVATMVGRLATARTVPADARAFVDRLARELPLADPAGGFANADPFLVEELLAGLVWSVHALLHADPRLQRRDLRLGLERVRQALRDLAEAAPVAETRPAKDVARWVADVVDAPQPELAGLLGVSPRTFQRWISRSDAAAPAGDEAVRLRIVARLIAQLRHGLTGAGVVRWFGRPHPALGGSTPASLLDDPNAYHELVRLAAGLRASAAT